MAAEVETVEVEADTAVVVVAEEMDHVALAALAVDSIANDSS